MNHLLFVSLIMLFAVSFGSAKDCECKKYQASSPGKIYSHAPAFKKKSVEEVARSLSTFSGRFVKTVSKIGRHSMVSSPFGASILLAILSQGAKGLTATKIRNALQLPSYDWYTLVGFQDLIDRLAKYKRIELRMVNKVYLPCYINPLAAFKETTTMAFRSELESLDFKKAGCSKDVINKWCWQKTDGFITNIVHSGDLDASTSVVLLSAVYFKGTWAKPFARTDTKLVDFHGETTTTVQTMNAVDNYNYGELPGRFNAKYVEIPYADNDVSMIIILPNKKSYKDLLRVENNLHKITIEDLLKYGRSTKVDLFLPKFSIESELHLEETAKRLNMSGIFYNADFKGVSDYPVDVSNIRQKAFIEIDEAGAGAPRARAQNVSSFTTPVTFKADHPFVAMVVVKKPEPYILLAARYTGS